MGRLVVAHSRRRRRGAVVAVALLAGACGGTNDVDQVTVVRAGFIQALDQVPFSVIADKGFDARRGLGLRLETVAGGRAALEALAAGTLDVAYAGSLPVLSAARAGLIPERVMILGAASFADSAHPSMAVLAPESSRWADLAGRDIGVNQIGSIGEVAVRLRLQREGVVPRGFVEIGFPNQGLALAGGQVAAAVMTEPYLTQSTARGDGHILDAVIGGGEPFPRFVVAFIAVRADLVREQPGTVRAFLHAHLDAVDWIADHPSAARAAIARHLAVPRRVVDKAKLPGLVPDVRVDGEVLADMQDTLAAADPAFVPVEPERLIDRRLLEQVLGARA